MQLSPLAILGQCHALFRIILFCLHCISKPPGHCRTKDVGPPSLKVAATALLWLIQPEVLKHFSPSEVVRGRENIRC